MLGALLTLKYFTIKIKRGGYKQSQLEKKINWSSGQHVTVLKTESLSGEGCWDGGGSRWEGRGTEEDSSQGSGHEAGVKFTADPVSSG